MDAIHPLYKKSLLALEYHKVLDMLSSLAVTGGAKERALNLLPLCQREEAALALSHTTAARGFIERRGTPSFYGAADVRGALSRASIGAVLSLKELREIAQILKLARLLLSYREEEAEPSVLDGFFNALCPNRHLEDEIFDALISDTEISDTASTDLNDIRRRIRSANSRVRDALNKIIHSTSYQKYLQEPIISMRGDRYVIPVKNEHRGEIKGLIHDTSSSGATVFIEPLAVVEANNEIKMLLGREQAEIERILGALSAMAGEWRGQIESNYHAICELDLIFAKAKLSHAQKGTHPDIKEGGHIYLKRARHPLLDRHTVVPISVELGGEFDTLVITGPNTGGKTVTLKTLGLFCAMAASGLHIPCDEGSSTVIFENIFADIGDEQSIEQNLSTFSSHMTNIVAMTRNMTRRTLLLFDELGAGTDPVEGAALAASILEAARASGALVAATTHYSELKLYALSTKGVENASCEFDVSTLRPTYRLLIGVPGRSNAFAISARLGLSDDIIEAARHRIDRESIAFEDIIGELEKNRARLEEERVHAERLRLENEEVKAELSRRREEYQKGREQAMEKARNEARRIIEQARFCADRVMEELDELKKLQKRQESAKRQNAARVAVSTLLSEGERAMGADALKTAGKKVDRNSLKIGQEVSILNLSRPGVVVTLPGPDGQMTVRAGIMNISVNVDDLGPAPQKKSTPPKNNRTAEGTVHTAGGKMTREIRQEVDLRGKDVEEAIFTLDKYLDESVMSGLGEVTAIHGKGTGVLRAAVHRHLKNHPHVKSFRLGKYGEGETGVTVIELK